ncbi:putative sulfate exporter family transporter [Corynebacterium hindlerae]|uniref:Putative sulfate exporter family transporter n=1 Tax=Corynebacterium hindlerae TaxID=699041 RepID=A0A7G5FE55_9CORY|nr:putative sulfate exporter family transporter [Corynebacterium hindlerae]QMV84896.1 putative sulfate exporter family transporter [Corynebacterium hindlerae]
MTTVKSLAPGVGLCVIGAVAAYALDLAFRSTAGFSALILIAIVLGIVVGNVRPVSGALNPGVAFTAKKVLRFGVAILGFSISLATLAHLGPAMLGVVLAIVAGGIGTTYALTKWSSLSREHVLMIGAGCSICGAAAISAVESVLPKRKTEEIASAIAVIVVLGTMMIFAGPLVAWGLGFSPEQGALFIGGATHEVGQVVAGGLMAGVVELAVAIKLGRVLLLAPVVALIGMGGEQKTRWTTLVPVFVQMFILAVLARTFLPIPEVVLDGVDTLRTWLFAAAMFALGTSVTARALLKSGARPFLVGAVVSGVIIVIALLGTQLI